MNSSSLAGGPENLFFSLKDPIRRTYALLDSSVLVFGVFFNAILLHLIRTKTVSAMRTYSKILAVSCAMDLVASVSTFLVQPIPVPTHGYRIVIVNGLFRHFAHPIRFAAWLFWIQVDLFFLVTTMCQYVCRYCIMCRGGKVPKWICWSLAVFCFLAYTGHGVLQTWADYPRPEDESKMAQLAKQMLEEDGLTEAQFNSFVNARDYRFQLHNTLMGVIVPSFYVVIFLCSSKIRRAINEMNVLKLREYNNQVSAVLLFQALLPTLELLAWNVQQYVPTYITDRSTVWLVAFSDVPIHLIPVINGAGTIWLVRPYRRAFLAWLGLRADSRLSIVRTATQILTGERGVHPAPESGDTTGAALAMTGTTGTAAEEGRGAQNAAGI